MYKLLRLLLVFCITLGIGTSCQPDAPVITIIHTNDTHSQFEPGKTRQGTVQGGVV